MARRAWRNLDVRTALVVLTFSLAAGWWLWQTVPEAIGQAPLPPALAVVGQAGGAARAVAADRGRAVLAVGQRLYVLNVDDPAQPVETAHSPLLAGTVHDVAVAEGYAFAALGQAGVAAVDLLPQPPLVVALRPLGQEIQRVVAANGFVYAVGPTMLFVLDPGTLTVVGRTVLGVQYPQIAPRGALAVAGTWAYVLRQGGMDVVDLSNPAAPMLVGAWRGSADDVAVTPDGRHVLLADAPEIQGERGTFRVIDVTNPTRPRQVAELDVGGRAIAVRDDQAWLVDGARLYPVQDAIRVIDIADPLHPRQLTGALQAPLLNDVAISDDVLLVTADGDGLRTFSAADPAALTRLGGWVTRPVTLAALVGTTTYALSGRMLQVVDATDTAAPRLVAELDLGIAGRSLAARGGFVYVGGEEGELRVVDANDPAQPKQVAALKVGTVATIHGMSATTRYLWLATDGDLLAYDVSTPASPRRVGSFQLASFDVAVADGRAYVAAGTAGLVVLDVRDPAAPRELGRLSFSSAYPGGGGALANQIVVDAGTAYVGLDRDGVVLVSAQDPAKMRELSRVPALDDTTAVALSGDQLLAADHPDAAASGALRPLQVIDRRDAQRPRVLVGPAIDAGLTDVASGGGLTVVAAEGGGLLLLRPVTEVPATPTLIARDTATPRPQPTRPPTTPNPAWRRMALLPFAMRPPEQYIPCPPGCGTTIAGQQGGSTRLVASEGDRLYLLVGDRLAVYGLADPARPTLLGQTAPLPGTARRLVVKDGVAYVVATVPNPADTSGYVAAELQAVDARAPAAPMLTGRAAFARIDPLLAEGLELAWGQGQMLALWPAGTRESSEARLSELRLADPLRPRATDMVWRLGRFAPLGTRIAPVGKLLAVAGQLGADGAAAAPTLRLLDLSVPAAEPKVVGQVGVQETYFTSVASTDKHVFLGAGGLVRVVDASVPAKPKLLGFNEAFRMPADSLVLTAGTLHGASTGLRTAAAMELVDVRDPYRPTQLGAVSLAAPPADTYLAGNLAVAAGHAYQPEDTDGGLRVVDVRSPAQPKELAPLTGLGLARCLAIAGDHLLAGWPVRAQVAAFRRADPAQPTLSATTGAWSPMRHYESCHLAVAGDTAYLAGTRLTLDTLDVSNPAQPQAVGGVAPDPATVSLPAYGGLALAGTRTWRAWNELGLLPVDVADRSQPRTLPRIAVGDALDIAVAGDLAYVAASYDGLSILNVRDLANVREIGFLAMNGQATEVALDQKVVWVAVEREPRAGTTYDPAEVVTVDVADPAKPRVLGSVDLPGRVRRLRLDGTTLWVASEAGILRIVAGDPARPRIRERLAPYTGVVDVVAAPGWAYAASDTGALWSVQVSP